MRLGMVMWVLAGSGPGRAVRARSLLLVSLEAQLGSGHCAGRGGSLGVPGEGSCGAAAFPGCCWQSCGSCVP